jgi:hypothetical protein
VNRALWVKLKVRQPTPVSGGMFCVQFAATCGLDGLLASMT